MILRYLHWKDDSMFLGYLLNYPDYMTQGESLEDLKEHMLDLYKELGTETLPYVRKVDELVIIA